MWVRSLRREDPLEEGTATHCSILAGAIAWTEEPGGLQALGSQRVRTICSEERPFHPESVDSSYRLKRKIQATR